VFERFTERAERVTVLAQDEARISGHSYVGTEHLLLGLVREREGLASRVLEHLGVSPDRVREQLPSPTGSGNATIARLLPLAPLVRSTFDLAVQEALSAGVNFVGTEHILLALARIEGGAATDILRTLDVNTESLRVETVRMLFESRAGSYARQDVGDKRSDFTPTEAVHLALRLAPLSARIVFVVHRQDDHEMSFQIACDLDDNHAGGDLATLLQEAGVRAIVDESGTARIEHLDPPGYGDVPPEAS
jgi:ATP-dependent Clp protease ATP-binding subunit ClpA